MVIVPVQSEEENGVENGYVDGLIGKRKTVLVKNDIDSGVTVNLHCRSKDDDLGLHVLRLGEQQVWSFRDNIFRTTLFWCTMDAKNKEYQFEIYRAKTDRTCTSQCFRSLREDGAYFWNQPLQLWEKRISWSIQ
ncbi:self-incompatibility protein S1 [Cajanus cajan]|nr:self-incompatibility protein S1 [Cajanus cajan]